MRKKLGEILLPGNFNNCEIAAIHDADAHGACCVYESTKVRVEFRGTTSDVQRGHAFYGKERKHCVHHLARHLFSAVRAGVDVAVHA